MKVLLINPTFGEMNYFPPLGLVYIGAYLEQAGHEVRLLNRDVLFREKQTIDPVDQESGSVLKAFQPDLIGITAMTLCIPDAFHVAALTKRLLPKVPVVLGGVHASILSRETLEASPDIDIVVRGEGEATMKELCDGADFGTVAGIVYRRNGEIINAPDRNAIANLDELPFPARHLYDMNAYLTSGYGVFIGVEARITHLFTSRGCPYRCTYCASGCVFGAKVRFVSPQRVIEEIENVVSAYPVESFMFCDDIFASHRKRALEICRLLIERRLHRRIVWSAQLHVDHCDEELLRVMKKAGCVQVSYGFESGSQRILDIMNKRTTVRKNHEAAALTRKVGLLLFANVLFGTPGETREDFMATIEFLKTARPNNIWMFRFVPLPGSKMFNDLRQKGLIESDWSKYHYGITHPQEMNFTAMTDQELNELCHYYYWHLAKPAGDRGYISYNLIRKPFRTLKNIPGLLAAYPAVPGVARDLVQKPVRTLKYIAGRIAADPDVLPRNVKGLISRR